MSEKLGISFSIESYCSMTLLLLWIDMSASLHVLGQTDMLLKQDHSGLAICASKLG